MKLYEYEAMEILSGAGLRVPNSQPASTPDEALAAAESIGYPVMVKAQALTGGRGLAGGIKEARSPDQLRDITAAILGMSIKGMVVGKVLIAEKVEIGRELYLGITIDGAKRMPMAIAGSEGGINIEEAVKKQPDKMASMHISVDRGLLAFEARKLLTEAGFPKNRLSACADALVRLYQAFIQYDGLMAEINPLVITTDGALVSLDAKFELDDSALFRSGKLYPKDHDRPETPLEKMGRELGMTYVELDGDIAIISSGAGLGMATIDIIGQKLKPANFLETGGGITEVLLYKTMDLIMKKPGIRAVFINIYGGINPIHEGAKGVVRYMKEKKIQIPVVAKALGNREEETWEIFRAGGVEVITEISTEKAVERIIEVLGR